MICQECHERPATLHFTKILNGEKTEIHICDTCAKENEELSMFSHAGFSFNSLLSGLLNFEASFKDKTPNTFPKSEVIQCERCKLTLQQFVKTGRFGCSNCYRMFQGQLDPVLKRLHSGNTSHAGKIPKRIGGSIHIKQHIKQLRIELKELISKEEFEEAATIRDQIRELENTLNAHKDRGEGV
jgi:protein arginine kinase activator